MMKHERICLLVVCLSFVVIGTCARSYENKIDDKTQDHKRNAPDGEGDGVNIDDDDYSGFNPGDENGKTIDEIIVEATNKAHGFDSNATVNSSDPNRLVKIEYDMVFTEKELEEEGIDDVTKDKRALPHADVPGMGRWRDNRIPYQFAPDDFSTEDKREILAGMSAWAQYTCVTFHDATEGDRLYFQNGNGCHSRVGRKGGSQIVSLARGCRVKPIVMHEIGHAIGLIHEQLRPDRDDYVTIQIWNVHKDLASMFKKYPKKQVDDVGVKYDYRSIMHFGGKAFSYTGNYTIKTKDPAYQNVIGRSRTLSFGDIKAVNLMQKCAQANKCKLTDDKCPGAGFVGKDCKCWCPGDPYRPCKMGGDTGTSCQDDNFMCPAWAKMKRCNNASFKAFMTLQCRKSCQLCNGADTGCKDETTDCKDWAKNGECERSPNFMKTKCTKSCNIGNCNNGKQ